MPPRKKQAKTNGKTLATQQSVNQAVKAVCDIMRRGSVTSAIQYVPELTWLLFLRVLDETETNEAAEAAVLGKRYTPSVTAPYRWSDWAAPDGAKRLELEGRPQGQTFAFVNGELLPHLRGLETQPEATARQRLISEIMRGVDQVRIDTEKNLLDVLDKLHELSNATTDQTHVFMLSQVYEGLLLKMGEKNNDGGQFFTPREVIRAMIRVLDPRIGETVYDPGCGTGGFLAEGYGYMRGAAPNANTDQLADLKERTFYGREKERLIYPVALANLVLHGIDHPHIWFGNTLTGQETYGALFAGAPGSFQVIATNPPFGGKEGKEAQDRFDYKTGSTQVLFLQHVMQRLDPKRGRCGIVVDEGLLFRTNETAFVQTKRKLLEEFDLWCVVSLPGGVFTQAGAGVKTNLLFFKAGEDVETTRIWYYDLSDLKVTKRQPLKAEHFRELFELLPTRADSANSWTVDLEQRAAELAEQAKPFLDQAAAKRRKAAPFGQTMQRLKAVPRKDQDKDAIAAAEAQFNALTKEARALEAKAEAIEDQLYDLKAVNPNRKAEVDTRTPEELLDFIEAKGREIDAILAELRAPVDTSQATAGNAS